MNYLKLIALFGSIANLNAQKLELPESAAYNVKTEAYFISSIKNNLIYKQDKKGNKNVFVELDSNHSLGVTMFENILYIVADDQIKGIDILSKKEEFVLTINDAHQLNDITNDENGNLYVSDRLANIVYKINPKSKKYEQLVKPNGIITPNGVFYSYVSKMLYVCTSVEKAEIHSVNPTTGENKLLYKSDFENFDGIAVDANQNIYVTSWDKEWKTSKLLQFAKTSKDKQPKIILDNANGMADLNYNAKENKIIITNTLDNSITLLKTK